jgi:hypothetical protein
MKQKEKQLIEPVPEKENRAPQNKIQTETMQGFKESILSQI